MGVPISMFAQVEILAPPATVRSIFLDFPRYKEWHQGWDVRPVESGKISAELNTGDKVRVAMHGMVFHTFVTENSAECFIWEASLYGLLAAKHEFAFSPSAENPGGTTFIQREQFVGALTLLFWPWSKKNGTSQNWEKFNAALKMEAEKMTPQA